MIRFSLITILLANIITAYAGDEQADFNLQEVADNLYVHVGKHVELGHEDEDDIANIGFIIGSKCVAVIDSGGSINIGRMLKEKIAKITDLPVCYVINTHVHFDHILGNFAFQADKTIFIGHKNLAPDIAANSEFFVTNYPQAIEYETLETKGIIQPMQHVDDELVIDLGDRKLTLTAHPIAHTHNDLSIYDHNTKTLWLADLLFVQRVPIIDGSLLGWLSVMAEIKTKDVSLIIPGHGHINHHWKQALNIQERYLQTLLKETRAKIAEGQFLEDIINEVGQSEQDKWLFFEQYHKRNISKAFIELEWE